MTLMIDSVTPGNIPASTQIVGGYVNGQYAWKASDWARFPLSHHVTISVMANGPTPEFTIADVLDVETGDAAPQDAPGWCQRMRFIHVNPTVYCNASTWPAVRQAFIEARVPQPHYWIADYDGIDSVPAQWASLGCVAKQFLSTTEVDLSVTALPVSATTWPVV
jgi:hypothetical protein